MKLIDPPVRIPSRLHSILCRLGYHDFSGGILPGLFEMRFKEIPGTYWPISSSIFTEGYCVYCGECVDHIIVIPSKENPPGWDRAGSLADIQNGGGKKYYDSS